MREQMCGRHSRTSYNPEPSTGAFRAEISCYVDQLGSSRSVRGFGCLVRSCSLCRLVSLCHQAPKVHTFSPAPRSIVYRIAAAAGWILSAASWRTPHAGIRSPLFSLLPPTPCQHGHSICTGLAQHVHSQDFFSDTLPTVRTYRVARSGASRRLDLH